jgi:hypothetical protein
MDLLQKLKAGTANRKQIKWPDTDDMIEIRVASEQDHLDAVIAADNIFRDHKIGFENVQAYQAEIETQLLYRCILENGERLFKNITEFRSILTPEVKNLLAETLNNLHEDCSPSPFKMSDAEFDKFYDSVKKKPEETLGKVSSTLMLRRLILFIIKQLPSSQTDSGTT